MAALRAVCLAAAVALADGTSAAPAAVAAAAVCPPLDAHCCHITARDPAYRDYKADPQHQVQGWAEVNLDLPPAERWAHIVQPKAEQIRTMITHFKSFLGSVSRDIFAKIEKAGGIKRVAASVLDSLGDYGAEIRGIANATGIAEEEILLVNIMYEIEGGCTSIVAQDSQGHLVHARNLDFGVFFGEDWRHGQWIVTEDLRPILMNVRFVKGGNVMFNSTTFLGYIGVFTGAKRGAFSISFNTRFDSERWAGLMAYLKGTDRSGHFLSLLVRDLMLTNATYEEALATFRTAKILGPSYIILGGIQPGQGAIVARSAGTVLDERNMADAAKGGSGFLVQTNWDYPKDPWYDNRRSPAEECLRTRYQENIDFEGMFQVLSAHPNRNRLTTHTAVFSAQTGEYEAYLQFCKEAECAPWLPGNLSAAALVV